MSVSSQNSNSAYGLKQALVNVFPSPIIGRRNPTAADKAPVGQVWINKLTNTAYTLTSIVNNASVWATQASTVAGALNVGGALTVGTGVTVTLDGAAITGNSTVTGTFGVTGLTTLTGNTAVVGSFSATTTGLFGTGLTVTAGGLTVTAGNLAVNGGSILASTSVGAGTSLAAGTTVVAGTSITATLGNITATNGNLVLSTATNHVVLPGPVKIMSGAGDPAAGLAVNVGDMYIKTNAASAATRIFIATAANTWTNVTCAA